MNKDDLFEKVYIATIAAIVSGQSARGTLGNGTDTQIEELSEMMAALAYSQAGMAVAVFGDHRQFDAPIEFIDFTDFVEDFDPNPDSAMERELQDGEYAAFV